MGPVVAPAGTVATISVVELTVNEAGVPLKLTVEGVMKLAPLMITLAPTSPPAGEKPLIEGVVLEGPVIVKPGEILKKMFPLAATLIRAFEVALPGIVTVSDPSFGVSFARIIGKEFPPSVESVIFTLAQLAGANERKIGRLPSSVSGGAAAPRSNSSQQYVKASPSGSVPAAVSTKGVFRGIM